jgi:hypothetical protein
VRRWPGLTAILVATIAGERLAAYEARGDLQLPASTLVSC